MTHLINLIQEFGLGLVFLNVLVEQAGLPIPAYPTLIVAGAYIAGDKTVVLALLATGVSRERRHSRSAHDRHGKVARGHRRRAEGRRGDRLLRVPERGERGQGRADAEAAGVRAGAPAPWGNRRLDCRRA